MAPGQTFKAFGIRGLSSSDDALFGDYAGDEAGGGDVEGGVIDADAFGGGWPTKSVTWYPVRLILLLGRPSLLLPPRQV